MKLRVLPAAVADLNRGREFYDRQNDGVGDYFLDSLFSDIDSLALYAGMHIQRFGYYRLLSKRFPFAIYYKVDGAICIVWRVLDCRQNPKKIRNTLKRGT